MDIRNFRDIGRAARRGVRRASAIPGMRGLVRSIQPPPSIGLLSLELVLGDALSVPMVRFSDRINECELAVEHELLVQTEPAAWYQVVSNLVANSAKHGFGAHEDGVSIALSAGHVAADRVRVTYRDDGCGFSKSARAAAFKYRHDGDATFNHAGLGLRIVDDIVRSRLHGTITLREDAEGAVFDIDVPILGRFSPPF